MSSELFPAQPGSPTALVRPRLKWFCAWLIVGAGYALGLLSMATIGLFVLPCAVLTTILLTLRRNAGSGLPGLVSGLGFPPLYVAYLNRSGPGTVCTTIAGGGQACTGEWSPWPWLAAGVILLALGIAVFIASLRHLSQRSASVS